MPQRLRAVGDSPAAHPQLSAAGESFGQREEGHTRSLAIDDHGYGTAAVSGRRSMVATQASKNALASGRPCNRVKR